MTDREIIEEQVNLVLEVHDLLRKAMGKEGMPPDILENLAAGFIAALAGGIPPVYLTLVKPENYEEIIRK